MQDLVTPSTKTAKTCRRYHGWFLRGGRITKQNGIAASCAPLLASASLLAMATGFNASPALAACAVAGTVLTCGAGVITSTGTPGNDVFDFGAGSPGTLDTAIFLPGAVVDGSAYVGPHFLLNSVGTGSLDVTLNPGVTFTGGTAAQNFGINLRVQQQHDGDVTVTNDGATLTSFRNYHKDQILVEQRNQNGNATIVMNNGTYISGDAANPSDNSHGNFIHKVGGTGNSYIEMNDGLISTYGRYSLGLKIYHRNGATGEAKIVMNGGTITTLGMVGFNHGIHVRNRTADGLARVIMTGGDIKTFGDSSYGIFFERNYLLGDVDFSMTDGTIETQGEISHEVHARRDAGDNTGTTDIGDVTFNMSAGNIITNGDGARGLYAYQAATGNLIINFTGGTITTNGGVGGVANTYTGRLADNGAHGIHAYNNVDGQYVNDLETPYQLGGSDREWGVPSTEVTVTSGGAISVNGPDSDGIRAEASKFVEWFWDGTAWTYGPGTIDPKGLDVPVTVDVTGGTIIGGTGMGNAIHTISSGQVTINIAAGATIDGSAGFAAIRDGDAGDDGIDYADVDGTGDNDDSGGNATITTSGTIIGDVVMGLGDDVFNFQGGEVDGNVYGDDKTASGFDGDDSFNWTGGDFKSGFYGQNGSDTAVVSAGAIYDGLVDVLDGGDDVLTADGWIDVLTREGQVVTANGGNIVNWEVVNLNAGTNLIIADGALTVGSVAANGLFVNTGATLSQPNGLTPSGNLTNGGTVTMQNGSAGATIGVSGNYTGANGTLAVQCSAAMAHLLTRWKLPGIRLELLL